MAGGGIHVSRGSTGAIVRNNISYDNAYSNYSDEGTGTTASNNLTTNPMFTNVGAADFTLQPGSPAVDAGVAIAPVSHDFNGAARPVGARPDIGAFEFGGSADPGPRVPSAPKNLRVTTSP